jgi:site-specific recombinase XerD
MYIASLAVENKAKTTMRDYTMHLRRFFAHVGKPYNTVATNDIRFYLHSYQTENNIAKSTLDHVRTVINSFYNWLVDQEYIERNPARRIEPIKVPKEGREPIPLVELERLRLACKTPREKALIDFLFSTGCRISECAALEMRDIDWRDRSVKIRHGKGDKFRITYFNIEAEVSLQAYIASKKHDTNVLFSKTRSPYGHISSIALEREVRKIRSRVPDLSVQVVPHALRDTFATTLSQRGMPIEQIQQLLGHSSLDTTRRYVRTNQEEARINHSKYIA